MKVHDLLKLAWWWSQERPKHVAIKNLQHLIVWILMLIAVYDVNILLIAEIGFIICARSQVTRQITITW